MNKTLYGIEQRILEGKLRNLEKAKELAFRFRGQPTIQLAPELELELQMDLNANETDYNIKVIQINLEGLSLEGKIMKIYHHLNDETKFLKF